MTLKIVTKILLRSDNVRITCNVTVTMPNNALPVICIIL